jgi:hypothetical protein
MKKIITITIIFAFFTVTGYAQEASHEYSVHVGGGMGSLNYKLPIGEKNGFNLGGEFGFGYTYTFSRPQFAADVEQLLKSRQISYWGIHAGIGLGLYGAGIKINDETTVNAGLFDSDKRDDNNYKGDLFDLHSTIHGYEETQRLIMLNIPVMGMYRYGPLYGMAGFKFGIPVSGNYSGTAATMDNVGFYPEFDNWLKEPRDVGYGNGFEIAEVKNRKLDFRPSVALALEAGWRFNLTGESNFNAKRKYILFVGGYFDLGLNDMAKNIRKDNAFVNYTPTDNWDTEKFTTNSILAAYKDKVNVMAFGIKLRLAISPSSSFGGSPLDMFSF